MSPFPDGNCPWSVLGLSPGAPLDKVQHAFRKLALKWHPDHNNGCPDANARFQQLKDALDEIKHRAAAAERHQRAADPFRRPPSASTASSRARARAHPRPSASSGFYGFRRDTGRRGEYDSFFRKGRSPGGGGSSGVRDGPDPMRSMRARMRAAHAVGLGMGIAIASVGLAAAAFGIEVTWRSHNRGRSFEEMMRGLDERRLQEEEASKADGEAATDGGHINTRKQRRTKRMRGEGPPMSGGML